MKKFLMLFLIVLIFLGIKVHAEQLSEDLIDYKNPIGTLFAASAKAGGSYLIDGDNNILAGPFEYISDFSGFPYAKAYDGTMLLFDLDGSVIATVPEGEEANPPANGIYSVTQTVDEKKEYVYYSYETRAELFRTDSLWMYYLEQQSDRMFIERDGKWAIINNRGVYITEFIYDDVKKKFNPDYEPYPKSYAIVVVGGEEKYIDHNLNEINLGDYNGERFITQCYPIRKGAENFGELYVVESGDLSGIYDNAAKTLLIPYQKDLKFREMNDKLIIAQKNDLYGMVDYSGNIIVPFEYNNLTFMRDEYFIYYQKDMTTGYFDPLRKCEVSDIVGSIVEPGIMLSIYSDYSEGYKKYCGEIINFAGHNLTGEVYAGVSYNNGQFYAAEIYTDTPDIPVEVDRSFAVVKLNGVYLPFDGCIRDSRTMVPMREIVEGLGGEVLWDSVTMTATALIEGKKISMTVGEKTIMVDGCATEIDVPAQLINEKTMLPVRALCENIGAGVDWDERIRCVYITK